MTFAGAAAVQARELEALCAGLSESGAMFRYAEGKWTVKEVIGHLLDTERVFGYRLLRISRGDVTELPGFDETTYVPEGQFDQRSVEELVGLVSGLRMVFARALGHLSTSFWGTLRIIIVFSESVIGCRYECEAG